VFVEIAYHRTGDPRTEACSPDTTVAITSYTGLRIKEEYSITGGHEYPFPGLGVAEQLEEASVASLSMKKTWKAWRRKNGLGLI
jgi:hypothetical protein